MARMPSVIAGGLVALVLGGMPLLSGCKTSRASNSSGSSGHCPSCRGQMGDEFSLVEQRIDQAEALARKQ